MAERQRSRSRSVDRSFSRLDVSQSLQENTNSLSNMIACASDATPLIEGKLSRHNSVQSMRLSSPRSTGINRGRSMSRDGKSKTAQKSRSTSRSYYDDEL